MEYLWLMVKGSWFRVHGSKVEVRTVQDTVYVERVDTVEVSSSKFQVSSSRRFPQPSALHPPSYAEVDICSDLRGWGVDYGG